MQKPEIVTTEYGFAIVSAKGADAVSFAEASAIVDYKLDELMVDLVCCDIVTSAGDGTQMRTIHEELSGFDTAIKAFETLPSFDRQWREAPFSHSSLRTEPSSTTVMPAPEPFSNGLLAA